MNIRNLQFFDYNGYNLNFELNDSGYWEGNIYLPKVSVGLYANTTIYILEKINNLFYRPIGQNNNEKIVFKWDLLNKFVDEFFMFTFDEDYKSNEESSLVYTPNDGPDCETLLINTFDTYEIPLDKVLKNEVIPVHIGFIANEKYDATTYNRTLFMYYNGSVFAKIKFYAETVEEDERLTIWNSNLGYNITPEDEIIFNRSDIHEYKPDYILLNEKRKELILEGSNIYPYIGSYKAIINAIKFFGYENLNIIEYWKNVNPDDINFGKIYHSSKYSLKNKETIRIGARNIVVPNKDYKKINSLALVYNINELTGENNDWGLPEVREAFAYTLEEVLVKLFALKKKLDKEFMPGSSKIVDIIGEGNYFGLHKLSTLHISGGQTSNTNTLPICIDVAPSQYTHITDNTFFAKYLYPEIYENSSEFRNQVLSDISDTYLSEISDDSTNTVLLDILNTTIKNKNNDICEYYKVFKEYYEDNKLNYNDDYPYESNEYDYTKNPYIRFGGKFVLINKTFDRIMMENNKWDYNNDNAPTKISWKVTMSKDENQYDDDLRKIGIVKKYEYHDLENASTYGLFESDQMFKDIKDRFWVEHKSISEYNQFFIQVPFIGYYDVTVDLEDENEKIIQSKTFTKFLKVEPYEINLIGFYYDTRKIPEKISSEMDEGMYDFIQKNITSMHSWATGERTTKNIEDDASMPYYSSDGKLIHPGPYYVNNIENEWYLADNISYESAELKPFVKYTRYIKNGVDVKPYTWFLLGYEYSKISSKINPKWTIKNNSLPKESNTLEFVGKRYLTLLLKKEGEYTVTLELDDKLGNKYSISRNIIVVSKSANYKLYQSFKKDYDFISEQELLNETQYLNELRTQSPIERKPKPNTDVYVDIIGTISLTPDEIPVDVVGDITLITDKVPVNVIGNITIAPDETPVDVMGDITLTLDETPVDVVGNITLTPDDVPVNVEGNITYEDDVPTYTYKVNISDISYYAGMCSIGWFKDENMSQPIEGTGGATTITTPLENVWIKIDCTGCRVEPEYAHLTPEHTEVNVTIIQHTYRINLTDSSIIAYISWYKDENCTQLIGGSISTDPLFTGEDYVWAVISKNGYKNQIVPLSFNNPTATISLELDERIEVPVDIEGTITLTPDEVPVDVIGNITLVTDKVPVDVIGDITFTPDEVTVDVEGDITLTPDEVTVDVIGDINLTPDEVPVDVEGDITYEDENVEISAEPLVIKETYSYPDLQSESGGFPIIIKNSANKQIDYTVNISNHQNTYNYNFSKIADKQIDIYDNNDDYQYSIILCNKDGYTTGKLSVAHGTFTISSSNANNNVTFDVYGRTGVQHTSRVRTVSNYSFACVQLIPYKNESINTSFTLCGLADGAVSISGNRVYYYDIYHDYPAVQRTYTCHKNYANGNNYTFDTNTMIPNDISLTIGRLESTLSYSIAKNTTNRLKFGVVRLSSAYDGDDNLTSYIDSYEREFMCSILQESSSLRFALMSPNKTLSGIDTNYSYYYDKRNPTLLSIIDLSKPSGTEYTLTGKSYLVFLSTDIQNQITVKTANDEIITGQEGQWGNNRILYYNSSSQTFKITIN